MKIYFENFFEWKRIDKMDRKKRIEEEDEMRFELREASRNFMEQFENAECNVIDFKFKGKNFTLKEYERETIFHTGGKCEKCGSGDEVKISEHIIHIKSVNDEEGNFIDDSKTIDKMNASKKLGVFLSKFFKKEFYKDKDLCTRCFKVELEDLEKKDTVSRTREEELLDLEAE